MADLSEIKTSDRTIEILHPATGEKLGVQVTLVSIDDDRLQKLKRQITDRRLHLEARGKTFKAEEIEENKNNLLFTATTGWTWGKDADGEQQTFHGEVPEHNRKNFTAVVTELPWFGDQINEAVGDTKAFFSNSKPI